ncbi:hypothetical protein FY557_17295 [Chryseobacterium sp. SN22]|uniref:hypothetical protein n=1 Tax=Chryseobacterium sp. SN22 TaxID=2606431 RepID=UPI0011EC13D8|nr:hypothetical protein [Chryseobacterium sp. SN22]KAA0126406.1 hypothetical protein FY557_17295 [Chryseobacterium sp. SN22]
MKQQILEVQNYFVQKIQNKEYTLLNSEIQVDGWLIAELIIDDNRFRFGVKDNAMIPFDSIIAFTSEQKSSIIQSLQYLNQDFKEKSIQLLKDKIAELESQN